MELRTAFNLELRIEFISKKDKLNLLQNGYFGTLICNNLHDEI
jgi:hypothetical protein